MKVLFFILISLSLYANTDTLTNYRINGIENVEKQMDLELTRIFNHNEKIAALKITMSQFGISMI